MGRNEVGHVSPGATGDRTEPAAVIPRELADLLERPLYAHLATVRPDGTPQVNPTWVRFDGEYLWLTATTSRRKHRNWQIQPAVALSIADPDRPWRYLEVRGKVELIVPDPEGRSSSAWPSVTGCRRGPRRMPRSVLPSRSGRCTRPPSSHVPHPPAVGTGTQWLRGDAGTGHGGGSR
jgi:PPOX class probable F420-dependent enzyme